jgi:hypothetical protein
LVPRSWPDKKPEERYREKKCRKSHCSVNYRPRGNLRAAKRGVVTCSISRDHNTTLRHDIQSYPYVRLERGRIFIKPSTAFDIRTWEITLALRETVRVRLLSEGHTQCLMMAAEKLTCYSVSSQPRHVVELRAAHTTLPVIDGWGEIYSPVQSIYMFGNIFGLIWHLYDKIKSGCGVP